MSHIRQFIEKWIPVKHYTLTEPYDNAEKELLEAIEKDGYVKKPQTEYKVPQWVIDHNNDPQNH